MPKATTDRTMLKLLARELNTKLDKLNLRANCTRQVKVYIPDELSSKQYLLVQQGSCGLSGCRVWFKDGHAVLEIKDEPVIEYDGMLTVVTRKFKTKKLSHCAKSLWSYLNVPQKTMID